MLEAKGNLQRGMAGESLPQVCAPTILAVPRRNNCPTRHPHERTGDRVIIPSALRLDVLAKIYAGHQGVQKCRERAKSGAWWPGLSKQIEDLVRECPTCIKTKVNRAEPMIPSKLPVRPWQKVATDLFDWKSQEFALVVDYFSRYCEIAVL